MTNYDKITHILYEVFDVKPADIDEHSVTIAARLMDQVDEGEELDLANIEAMYDKVGMAMIVCDYIAAFYGADLTDDECEIVFSCSGSPGFFGDDREPLPVDVLHNLEFA